MTKLLSIGLDDAVDSNIDSTVIVPSVYWKTTGTLLPTVSIEKLIYKRCYNAKNK